MKGDKNFTDVNSIVLSLLEEIGKVKPNILIAMYTLCVVPPDVSINTSSNTHMSVYCSHKLEKV